MKRLMVMTGRAGKALLEINGDRSGAAVKYGGPGELWLFDGEGNSCRGGRPPFIPVGAMAVKNGTVLLTGGFAGRKELMERTKAEIMLRSPVPEKPRCDKERPAEKPSAPERQICGGAVSAAAAQTAAAPEPGAAGNTAKGDGAFPPGYGQAVRAAQGGTGGQERGCREPISGGLPVFAVEADKLPRHGQVLSRGGGPDAGSHIPYTRPAGRVPPGEKAEGLRQIFEGKGRQRILGKGEKGAVTTTYTHMRPYIPQESFLI